MKSNRKSRWMNRRTGRRKNVQIARMRKRRKGGRGCDRGGIRKRKIRRKSSIKRKRKRVGITKRKMRSKKSMNSKRKREKGRVELWKKPKGK